MAELARRGSEQSPIRNKAVELTRGLLQKDYAEEARACFEFCRDHVRYVRDILSAETLHDPVTMLDVMAGDCDDKSILLASLLASIGHQCVFVAVAFRPGEYSHVWTRDRIYGKWIDLETTEPVGFGGRIPTRGIVSELVQGV